MSTMINYCSGTYNYTGISMPEVGEMSNKTFTNDVKDTVHKWLMDDGWKVGKRTFPEAAWAFVAEDNLGRKIIVGQRSDRRDELLIQAQVTFNDDDRAKLDSLPQDGRDNFLWDLRFELLRTNLDFRGIQLPLKNMEVMLRISSDALTKDAFRQGISQVAKGILIIQWTFMRKFAQQPPQKQMGFLK